MQLVRKKMREIHFQHILQVHFIFDYMAFFLNLFTLIMQFFFDCMCFGNCIECLESTQCFL